MIRTILVPISGSTTDHSVCATALAAARPLAAHLDFYHLRMSCTAAAPYYPHLDFAVGSGLTQGLRTISNQEEALSIEARAHFTEFCKEHKLPLKSDPGVCGQVTVSFTEEMDDPHRRLLHRAKRNDLVVLGRKKHTDYMPPDLLEDLLLEGARPLLLAPARAPRSIVDTIMIGWNGSPAAERAVISALPFLKRARRVVAVTVDLLGTQSERCCEDLSAQLAWHAIKVEHRLLHQAQGDATSQLMHVSAQIGAEMIVIGGYGHGPLRETIFGGVSQALIEDAAIPVLMMH